MPSASPQKACGKEEIYRLFLHLYTRQSGLTRATLDDTQNNYASFIPTKARPSCIYVRRTLAHHKAHPHEDTQLAISALFQYTRAARA